MKAEHALTVIDGLNRQIASLKNELLTEYPAQRIHVAVERTEHTLKCRVAHLERGAACVCKEVR